MEKCLEKRLRCYYGDPSIFLQAYRSMGLWALHDGNLTNCLLLEHEPHDRHTYLHIYTYISVWRYAGINAYSSNFISTRLALKQKKVGRPKYKNLKKNVVRHLRIVKLNYFSTFLFSLGILKMVRRWPRETWNIIYFTLLPKIVPNIWYDIWNYLLGSCGKFFG